jgi:hypothetical protein
MTAMNRPKHAPMLQPPDTELAGRITGIIDAARKRVQSVVDAEVVRTYGEIGPGDRRRRTEGGSTGRIRQGADRNPGKGTADGVDQEPATYRTAAGTGLIGTPFT